MTAHGYIAIWIVVFLLEKDYAGESIRRSRERVIRGEEQLLRKVFIKGGDRLDFVCVVNITAVSSQSVSVGFSSVERLCVPSNGCIGEGGKERCARRYVRERRNSALLSSR